MFVLLPFAYFFIESEGFSGHRKVFLFIYLFFSVYSVSNYILAVCYTNTFVKVTNINLIRHWKNSLKNF